MPPLPVIAGVARCTFLWKSAHGITPRNVIHIHGNVGNLQDCVTDMEAVMTDNMWKTIQQDWAFDHIEAIRLDGTTASEIWDLSAQGSLTSGDAMPALATVVSMRTIIRGPRGRGRVFLGPMAESQQNNGIVLEASRALVETAWKDFVDGLPGESQGNHVCIASYAHADQETVTSVSVPTLCGTVRRRQDQLR
jgi:hypothetical protein